MDALARKVGERLKSGRAMLATAESCTGGWVAQALTAVPGSSEWFERGFVTYSDASKREMLGVGAVTLARHGAVSEETVREMALGTLANSHAQLSLAISGVAGPTGGTAAKPVGTVCLAWALRDGPLRAETRHYTGDRESIRKQSVVRALEGVLELLTGDPPGHT